MPSQGRDVAQPTFSLSSHPDARPIPIAHPANGLFQEPLLPTRPHTSPPPPCLCGFLVFYAYPRASPELPEVAPALGAAAVALLGRQCREVHLALDQHLVEALYGTQSQHGS